MIKLNNLLNEDIWMKPDEIPFGIKNWVKEVSGKNLQKYKVEQSGKVNISEPWHERSSSTYQKFQLTQDGNAIPVGENLSRHGYESDSPQGYEDGLRKSGIMEIPDGYIVVQYMTYPEMVIIHTPKNAQKFLPKSNDDFDLTMTEIYILAAAKQLKPFARPKFKDENYERLIQKGLLNKNRSITIDGRNLLQTQKASDLLKQAIDNYRSRTGRYSPVSAINY